MRPFTICLLSVPRFRIFQSDENKLVWNQLHATNNPKEKCCPLFGPCMSVLELESTSSCVSQAFLSILSLFFGLAGKVPGERQNNMMDQTLVGWLGLNISWLLSVHSEGRPHRAGCPGIASERCPTDRVAFGSAWKLSIWPWRTNKPESSTAHMRMFSVSRKCWTR